MKDKTYNTEREALDVIKNEKIWSKQSLTSNEQGERVNYRCNKIKAKAKEQCNSGLYILYHNDSASVTIYRSLNYHNHNELPEQSTAAITETEADVIKSYLEQGLRCQEVMNRLSVDGLPIPSKSQLNNFIAKIRKETRSSSTSITLEELKKMLNENSKIPEEYSKAFVIDFKLHDVNDSTRFNFFVSSKRLLINSIGAQLFVADTNYKIVWQDLPVLPIGTVDKDRHFHLIGMGVSTHETEEDFTFFFETIKKKSFEILHARVNPTIILSDANKSISNAFLAVYGAQSLVLMCWIQVRAAIKANIEKFLPKETQKSIMDDIEYLQLSRNAEMFENASRLFLEKYSHCSEFCAYFEREWLLQHRNWYEGAAEQTPSSNESLELFYKSFKQERIFRLRLPLAEFAEKLFNYIECWGIEYDNGTKSTIVDTLTLTLDVWTKGYQWSLAENNVISGTDENGAYLLVPGEEIVIGQWNECSYWQSFDKFKENSFAYWKCYMNENNWKQSKCTCPEFYKQYMCKHIVGIALRLQYAIAPAEARVDNSIKRKRGRPPKVKETFSIQ